MSKSKKSRGRSRAKKNSAFWNYDRLPGYPWRLDNAPWGTYQAAAPVGRRNPGLMQIPMLVPAMAFAGVGLWLWKTQSGQDTYEKITDFFQPYAGLGVDGDFAGIGQDGLAGIDYDYPMPVEGKMAKTYLWQMENDARELRQGLNDDDNLPGWVNNYVATSADRINTASRYMQYQFEHHNGNVGSAIPMGGLAMDGDFAGLGYFGAADFDPKYPLSELTRSTVAAAQGLNNQPGSSEKSRLKNLSNFLAELPFAFTVTSGYRSPAVNAAVDGSSSSAHLTGNAADVAAPGWENWELASWLYYNRRKYPQLDQVIWYPDTSHVHIGLGPKARAYNNLPGGFLKKKTKAEKLVSPSGTYKDWSPPMVLGRWWSWSWIKRVVYVGGTAAVFVTIDQVRRRGIL